MPKRTPPQKNEKPNDGESLNKQWLEELQNSEAVQNYLSGFTDASADSFIKDYGGKNLILDFEGSDAEPIAGFYKKFGAVLEPYTTLYVNKLPQPFKLLKPLPRYYHLLISKYK